MSITTTPMSPQKELDAARVLIQQQQERIEQLEADYAHLNDFEQTQSAKLLMKLAERDRRLEAAVRDMTEIATREAVWACGWCAYQHSGFRGEMCQQYDRETGNCFFKWRNAGMEGEG